MLLYDYFALSITKLTTMYCFSKSQNKNDIESKPFEDFIFEHLLSFPPGISLVPSVQASRSCSQHTDLSYVVILTQFGRNVGQNVSALHHRRRRHDAPAAYSRIKYNEHNSVRDVCSLYPVSSNWTLIRRQLWKTIYVVSFFVPGEND